MESSVGETTPKQQEENRSTIEGERRLCDSSTDSTGDATKAAEPMAVEGKNVKTLSRRLQHLSVSPPRQRSIASPTASMVGGRTTPPPGSQMTPRGTNSKPATPRQNIESGLPRTHSSPSLLDASPKSATGSQAGGLGPPPRMTTSRPSSRQTSPAVLRPAPVVHHELTPVTRNTSDAAQFVEDDGVIVVSPEDQLHGEHLALPSGVDYGGGPQLSLQHPLHQRRFSDTTTRPPPYLPVAPRSSVSSNDDLAHEARQHLSQQGILGNSWDETYRDQSDQDDDNIGRPVQFPRQKFYSFNSRQQYKAAVEEEGGAFTVPQPQARSAQHGLKPYQPSRNDLAHVGLPREELSSIFLPRRDVDSSRGSSSSSMNTIPLAERQWSIPSIRMANHVQGSTTDYTDEEDDLFRGYDDDASLSSRGSSLYLPEDGLDAERQGLSTVRSSSFEANVVIEDGMERVFHEGFAPDASAVAVAPSQMDINDDDDDEREGVAPVPEKSPHQERRKKRTKKNEKERKVYEWLRTVELGPENNVFCEAASSKFLTSGGLGKTPPLNRSGSSPATISSGRRDGNVQI